MFDKGIADWRMAREKAEGANGASGSIDVERRKVSRNKGKKGVWM